MEAEHSLSFRRLTLGWPLSRLVLNNIFVCIFTYSFAGRATIILIHLVCPTSQQGVGDL